MLTLYLKEVKGFFSNLMGYIVVAVFITASSLFMWVFPGELNILDAGFASLDTFFIMAPWVFLFLVPAITMRLFAEEYKSGTIELLLTRPLTVLQVVLAKYLAAVSLVLISLLPALISFFSVYLLGSPPGNLDMGGSMGSFTGLFFLASVYAAIGLFCSSLTDNQIIGFLIAIVLSFFVYIGFESISSLFSDPSTEDLVRLLGINEHYKSMSRGVLDSRDMAYFIGLIALFVLGTRMVVERRKR
ncbi:MAG: gliding motility-associated ABC transporter permease subunit GldF [Bacteroidales bacterium]